MRNLCTLFALFITLTVPYNVQAQNFIKSVTVEGAPIWTKHFQGEDDNFREHHGLGVVKIETENYGRWGVYYLSPNSVRDSSIGFGYVTPSWDIPLGPTELELSGALGLVTGYQDYPVPLVAGQARLKLFESQDGRWNAGIAAAALPYIAEDPVTRDNNFGIVTTTPFLSVRYRFNQ
jgi:hypothetical protein